LAQSKSCSGETSRHPIGNEWPAMASDASITNKTAQPGRDASPARHCGRTGANGDNDADPAG